MNPLSVSSLARPPASSPTVAESRVELRTDTGDLLLLHLKNVALTALTFGIYRFWAKTEMRRYLWGSTELWGEPLEYTGTPKELLKSFFYALLVVLFLYVVLVVGIVALGDAFGMPTAQKVTLPIMYAVFTFLGYVAAYGARRYRVTRTTWRGLRFDQAGSPTEFARKMFGRTLLCVLTAGLYYPYLCVEAHRYTIEHMHVGDQRFTFEGSGKDLFGAWVKAWLLAIPTLGFSVIWYGARQQRYLFDKTRFGAVRFRADLYAAELLLLTISNGLLMVVTLGLAAPVVLVRSLRFFFQRLAILGTPDFRALGQSNAPVRKNGEGLLDLLDGDIA